MEQRKKLKICYTSDIHGYFYPTTYADGNRENMGLFGCVADFRKDEETLVIDVLPSGSQLGGAPANFAYHAGQHGLHSVAVKLVEGLVLELVSKPGGEVSLLVSPGNCVRHRKLGHRAECCGSLCRGEEIDSSLDALLRKCTQEIEDSALPIRVVSESSTNDK